MLTVLSIACNWMATIFILAIEVSPVFPPLVAGPAVGYILVVMAQRGCAVAVTVPIPLLCMAEKRSYEFLLSSIFGRMSWSIEGRDLAQTLVISHVDHCCLEAFIHLGWYRIS